MSITNIPDQVRVELWVKAGGRCQYHGCNKALWREELTLRRMNMSYLAHIVADSPDGPRGDPELSEQLKDKFSNIMLLCTDHHRLIDRDVAAHPVDLLQKYKADHEERIERLTAMQIGARTEIVRFSARIKDRTAIVTFDQAQSAVAPERYPASERGIQIDLSNLEVNEFDPAYWTFAKSAIDQKLALALGDGVGPTGHPLSHLSVFALAPIPLLIYFGRRLGDTIPADVYQRHRENENWSWRELDNEGFNYTIIHPDRQDQNDKSIAVSLSLSGRIHDHEIETTLGTAQPKYLLTISDPRLDFLRAREQLELFRVEWRRLLTEIRDRHGSDSVIHLFPAVPNSVAIEMGRVMLPKSDPTVIVYDNDRENGGFRQIMTI